MSKHPWGRLALAAALAAGMASPALGAANVNDAISTGRIKLLNNPPLVGFETGNATVRAVLEMLAKKANMNFIIDDSVTGQISVSLKGLFLDEALDTVRKMKNLTAKRMGTTLLIASEDAFRRKGFGGLQTVLLRFDNASVSDIDRVLREALTDDADPTAAAAATAAAGPGGTPAKPSAPAGSNERPIKIIKDERTNSMLITAPEDVIDRARVLKALLDVPTPQVEIEVTMVEMSQGAARQLGLSYGFGGNKIGAGFNNSDPAITAGGQGNQSGNPSTPADGISLTYTALGNFTANFNARLNALIQEREAKVMANPKVVAQNGKAATIKIVNKHPILKSITSQTNTTSTVEFMEVGQTLTITPRIDTSGYVTLDLAPEIGVEGSTAILNGNPVPVVDTRSVSTTMRVHDNEPVIIGGLKRTATTTTVAKLPIPFLVDWPIIGNLFKNTVTNTDVVDVVLMVTPHIQTKLASSADGVFNAPRPDATPQPVAPPKY